MHQFRALLVGLLLLTSPPAWAGKIVIAAAADLKFALDEVVMAFRRDNPGQQVDVVYGSSGKLHVQIQQGAPYDLFFSADIAYPRALARAGFAATAVTPYGIGRLVLWSPDATASHLSLADLVRPGISRIAIANPKHAPYGKRAVEALQAAGVWVQVEPKLVHGENVAHAAQFVQSGGAQVGIIALSLVRSPDKALKGTYSLVPSNLHEPLEQGFIVTARARQNPLATRFAAYMKTRATRTVMIRYGFALPGESAVQ